MADMTVTNGNLLLQTDPANPAASLCISRMDLGQTVPLAQIGMYGGGTGNLQGVLSFRTMNSGGTLEERLHIHTDGNVGIGTNAPTQKLEVAGTVKASAFQGNGSGLTNVSGTDATKVSKAGDTMTGTLNLPANGLVVGTNQLIVSSGNVGIGTANPKNKLQIEGNLHLNGNSIFLRQGAEDQFDVIKWNSTADRIDIGGYYGVNLGYTNNGKGNAVTPALIVDGSGNVGMNGDLTVKGTIKRNGNTVLDRGNALTKYFSFTPSGYWESTTARDIDGFGFTLNVPCAGTLTVHMTALVGQYNSGCAMYLGPKINGAISTENYGGFRPVQGAEPQWIGTAAMNVRQVNAGSQAVQVNASIDGGKGRLAWGYLLVQFIPD